MDVLKNSFNLRLDKRYTCYSRVYKISFFVILALAILIRVLFFNQNPPALHQDEAMGGYNAYSISKTLKDSRGHFVGPRLHGFAVDQSVPLIYSLLAVPGVMLFGLNETTTRLPALIINVLFIVLMYQFTLKLLKNRIIALFTMLLLALNPLSIHFSRVGHDGCIHHFFYFLPLYLSYIAVKTRKNMYFILAGFFWGVAAYAYFIAFVMIPLFILLFVVIYFKDIRKTFLKLLISIGVFLIVISPLLLNILFKQKGISMKYGMTTILNYTDVIGVFTQNYFSHFTFKYLFFYGDANNLPGMSGEYGFFHPYVIVLSLIGISFSFFNFIYFKRFRRELLLLFLLLIVYPVGASITQPAPHTLRAYTSIHIILVFSGIGLYGICYNLFKIRIFKDKKDLILNAVITLPIIIILFVYSFSFLRKYYFVYPKKSFMYDYYQYGMKEVGEFLKENESKYDKVYFPSYLNQPFVYVLFYTQYEPKRYHEAEKVIHYNYFGEVQQFDKYYFVERKEIPLDKNENALYITDASGNLGNKTHLLDIYNPRNNVIFKIWD